MLQILPRSNNQFFLCLILILLEWKSSEIVTDIEGNEHSMRDPLNRGTQVYPDGMPVEMKYVEVKRIKIKHIDANTFEVLQE